MPTSEPISKKNLFIICTVLLVASILLFRNNENNIQNSTETTVYTAKISETALNVEIADSETKRITGLSYREVLDDNTGLLFVFENKAKYGIWMKDMNFAIDIAWLDENRRIIFIEREVSPNTFPKVFMPDREALYVLEVNSGFFDKNKISVGNTLEIKGF
ncbi:MAG: DUF192 domain-containing protein [Patescibacteria group bacterium]